MADIRATVAAAKLKRPHLYCPHRRCLWQTGGGRCPRHGGPARDNRNRVTRTQEDDR